MDKNVLQEIQGLRIEATWQCINKNLSAYSDSHLIIQSLNVVSMQAHMQDLLQDTSIMASHILCFQETKQAITQHPPQSHFSSISCYGGSGLSIWYGPLVRLQRKNDNTLPKIKILSATFETSFCANLQVVGV